MARAPNRHLTFGLGGPHFCLGAHLARLEVRIWLEEMLPYLDRIEPAGQPDRLRSNFFNGVKRLPVRVSRDERRLGRSSLQERGACAPCALLYTDLHGIARGKDIPIAKFEHLAEEGVAFCAAVMSTDLRHTPVVGGEEGYVDFSVRPDLATLRALPVAARRRLVHRRRAHRRRLRAAATCARGLLARVVARYARARARRRSVGPELEFFLLERDPAAPGGLRRYVDELSRVYTVGADLGPARDRARDALRLRGSSTWAPSRRTTSS